jgi:hypothetical protein
MDAAIDPGAPKTWGMLYEYLPHVMVKETLSFLEPAGWYEQPFGPTDYVKTGFWEKINFKVYNKVAAHHAITSDNMDMLLKCQEYCDKLVFSEFITLMCKYDRHHMFNTIEGVPDDSVVTRGLLNASMRGYIECVRYITARFPHIKCWNSFTIAYANKHMGVVDLLIEHPVHAMFYKKAMVIKLCYINQLDKVKKLYREIKDAGGKLPHRELNSCFIYVAHKGYLDIVKYLIELGADNITNAIIMITNSVDRFELLENETYQYLRQVGIEKLGDKFPKHL